MTREELKHYRDKISELVKRYHATNIRMFGSTVRDDNPPESDVDFLIAGSPKKSLLSLTDILKAIEKTEAHIQSGKQEFFKSNIF